MQADTHRPCWRRGSTRIGLQHEYTGEIPLTIDKVNTAWLPIWQIEGDPTRFLVDSLSALRLPLFPCWKPAAQKALVLRGWSRYISAWLSRFWRFATCGIAGIKVSVLVTLHVILTYLCGEKLHSDVNSGQFSSEQPFSNCGDFL